MQCHLLCIVSNYCIGIPIHTTISIIMRDNNIMQILKQFKKTFISLMTINPLSTPSTNTCCGKELAEDPEIEASSSATNSRSFTSKQIGVNSF